ncbi:HugZ family pyridoxamine 5'-phosphate oxidase [Hydrogenophaga pseudoflava]|uniref:HugZ family pyridoxamine 5'-phosphate oxidase n=1 Tax=Hydrogenophaga pseudoflava TaxID=47421 RepID=UPI0027E53CEC|nr:pyridoxamine 5'-phosphate oxidase family protein [Hydrogenophaga pseudoflava]MDQ7742845.1 pyridoxamine 5'-phosphate oxidase family protein [Hydrogenophaga pseudoflava]
MGEHSLTRALRELLLARRTAALGTLDRHGGVFVSMVPFAIDREAGELVLHVSALAAHSGNMQHSPHVSLLVCAAEPDGEPVHALPRVTLEARARFVEPGGPEAAASRLVYLQRFPEAEMMTTLGDFRFVRLHLLGARQVAGFGAARSLPTDELYRALAAI